MINLEEAFISKPAAIASVKFDHSETLSRKPSCPQIQHPWKEEFPSRPGNYTRTTEVARLTEEVLTNLLNPTAESTYVLDAKLRRLIRIMLEEASSQYQLCCEALGLAFR